MATLAIKGHATRGKEVIEILEMLGGRNTFDSYYGNDVSWCYTIKNGYLEWDYPSDKYKLFILEEFLEKFPYKVGDKVQQATSCGSIYVIEQMKWEDNQVKYVICDLYWKNCKCTVMSKDLQPYKEETMEDIIKIDIPKGYEFAGVDDDKQQVVFEKIGYQYPKTYKECFDVIGCDSKMVLGTMPVRYNILVKLEKLLICRDAYWKITGDWKPNVEDEKQDKYAISNVGGKMSPEYYGIYNSILCFPTREIRDIFFENFKDLIEQCKKLL